MSTIKKLTFAIAAGASLAACTDAPGAEKALQAAGYRDVRLTGYQMFGCDEKDTFRTGFTAIGPTGVRVNGAVCSGWLKGSTIRTW